MGQSKLASLMEQVINVASGWLLSLFVWVYLIVPMYDMNVQFNENLSIVSIFTLISVIRGFLWRRYFNGLTHRNRGRV